MNKRSESASNNPNLRIPIRILRIFGSFGWNSDISDKQSLSSLSSDKQSLSSATSDKQSLSSATSDKQSLSSYSEHSDRSRSFGSLNGFTLLELLVTTAILALMASIALPATRTTQLRTQLRQSAQIARGYVIDAKELSHAPVNTPAQLTAYGARFTQAGALLELLEIPTTGATVVKRSETLPAGTTIASLSVGGTNQPSVEIRFSIAPAGRVVVPLQPVVITIQNSAGSKRVLFNPDNGLPEVQ